MGLTINGPRWLLDPIDYLDHPYNVTLQNERAVEVPIARRFMWNHPGPGLEVGNVMRHYEEVKPFWVTVDKYDLEPDVDNTDVMDITGSYNWILSISTLEHVGWDEHPQNPGKCVQALHHLRSLLLPTGRLLVTIPTGYNPHFDAAIPDLEPIWETFLVRADWEPTWHARPFIEPSPYDYEMHTARGVWIAEFGCV